jgi:hypothetical protein
VTVNPKDVCYSRGLPKSPTPLGVYDNPDSLPKNSRMPSINSHHQEDCSYEIYTRSYWCGDSALFELEERCNNRTDLTALGYLICVLIHINVPDRRRAESLAVLVLPSLQRKRESSLSHHELFIRGVLYEEGLGGYAAPNLDQAMRFYRLSSSQGNAAAQYRLAVCLLSGRSLKKSLCEAVCLYRQAALNGFAPAQYLLGQCLELGIGAEVDQTTACYWYQAAAKQNYVEAVERLQTLEKKIVSR